MENKILWMWIKRIFPYSDTIALKLVEIFNGINGVYEATKSELQNINGLKDDQIKKLCNKDLDNIYKTYEYTKRLGVDVICIDDATYPERLKHIHEPPPVLYIKGDISCMDNKLVIAGVGTRECDDYGINMAKKIAADLSAAGVVIVSGMARGIDAAVHTGVFAENGKTIAVLGTAIDKIYPAENRNMYYKIAENGAVISEHPPGYYGGRYDFQRRNRVVAGLSDGVFVCQAPKKSGSMITAKMALDMGRDLFCVAGNADALNEGSNSLLMEGCAKMVLSAKDILNEYEIYKEVYDIKEPGFMILPHDKTKDYENLNEYQKMIVDVIGENKIRLDELCELTKMNFSMLASQITQLELLDVIDNDNGIISLK